MSRRGIICVEPDDVCEMCGKVDELRPYGSGGMRVCFDCGMKDEAEAIRRMKAHLFGDYEIAERDQ